MKNPNRKGFTLIEILIVIAIIAILAATLVPEFIGFDAEARVTTTKSNLETLRTTVNIFRAKESRYPASLEEMTTVSYQDMGVRRPYLKKIPAEMISEKSGNIETVVQTSEQSLTGSGGWAYLSDSAEVKVNVTGELGTKWGGFEHDDPSQW